MTPLQLKKLIRQGECPKVDLKISATDNVIQDISKDIAAFANTEGGHIILGVTNDRKVVGTDLDSEKHSRILNKGLQCQPRINVEIEKISLERRSVFVISIKKSPYIHSDDRNRFPMRIADTTTFMEMTMLLWLAKTKQLIAGEGPQQYFQQQERRKPNRSEMVLLEQLSNNDPEIQWNSCEDLASLVYRVEIDGIPELFDKISDLLESKNSKVRTSALNLLARLDQGLSNARKKQLASKVVKNLTKLALNESEKTIRASSLVLLSQYGQNDIVQVLVKIIKTEPKESFETLNISGVLTMLVGRGLGYPLREKLYEELKISSDEQIRVRIQSVLTNLRNTHWPM